MTTELVSVLLFQNGPIRFGISVDICQTAVPACEISPLPGAPLAIEGVFKMGDDIVAVVDPLRAFYRDRTTRLDLQTRFLLVRTQQRTLALTTDKIEGLTQVMRGGEATGLKPNTRLLREIATAPDGLIYITDPDALLSESEEARLSSAILEFSRVQ